MKRTLATVALAVVGLMTVGSGRSHSKSGNLREHPMGSNRCSPTPGPEHRPPVRCTSGVTPGTSSCSSSSIPTISITATWMEERRQVFLDAERAQPILQVQLGHDDCAADHGHAVHQAMDRPPSRHVDHGGDDDGLVQPRRIFPGRGDARRSRNTTTTSNAATGRSRRVSTAQPCPELKQTTHGGRSCNK